MKSRWVDDETAEELADRLVRNAPRQMPKMVESQEVEKSVQDPPGGIYGDPSKASAESDEEADSEEEVVRTSERIEAGRIKFWIGKTFYTRRLHRIDGCASSKTAVNIEFVENVAAAEYNCLCKKCFKQGVIIDEVSSDEESSSSEDN